MTSYFNKFSNYNKTNTEYFTSRII